MVSDGEIGTGTKSDRERERIKGTVTGRSSEREREHQKAGDRAQKGRGPEPGDRQPGMGRRLSSKMGISDGER